MRCIHSPGELWHSDCLPLRSTWRLSQRVRENAARDGALGVVYVVHMSSLTQLGPVIERTYPLFSCRIPAAATSMHESGYPSAS